MTLALSGLVFHARDIAKSVAFYTACGLPLVERKHGGPVHHTCSLSGVHFAIYPEGAFYKAHLDRHAGTTDRLVTVILYLNPDWQAGDGGELKLWTTVGEKSGEFELIEPRMGTLVCFMAGDFWHEVMPAKKTRMSITGWFRQR